MKRDNDNFITYLKKFDPIKTFEQEDIQQVLNFAYNMSFGENGEHRHYRSGGQHKRGNGEVFANAFQGKLSEFAVYDALKMKCDIKAPDLSTYGLGKWDDDDFQIGGKKISVKSTKSFGNLLLLETKDWNEYGQYIPNIDKGTFEYDFFILVRIDPNIENLLKKNRMLYSKVIDKREICEILIKEKWQYDIPGFISKNELLYAIKNNFIIKQNQYLNRKTKIDADNYYIQTVDMHDLSNLIELL